MKAVVLVGGEGTRLRPLTETIPKPLLPIVNRPFLHRVLDHLGAHGVHEVIASSSYLEESFEAFIAERHGDPRITWITESAPLGTGGAIVNALPHVDDTFFVLNGDILTDLDLSALLDFHRTRAAAATIALHGVDDARPFGLVVADEEGRVREFREKPPDRIPGEINAGTYVLERSALAGWAAGGSVSIEREIYPSLIARGAPVYGVASDAYWIDLGTPEKYLQAHVDVLRGRVTGIRCRGPFVASTASVDADADLGPDVVVGERSDVRRSARLDRSVLLDRVTVEEGAVIRESIVGPGATIGSRATVEDSVLAAGVVVEPHAELRGARVSAGRTAGSGAS